RRRAGREPGTAPAGVAGGVLLAVGRAPAGPGWAAFLPRADFRAVPPGPDHSAADGDRTVGPGRPRVVAAARPLRGSVFGFRFRAFLGAFVLGLLPVGPQALEHEVGEAGDGFLVGREAAQPPV